MFGFGVGIQRLGSFGVDTHAALLALAAPASGLRPTGFVYADPDTAKNGVYTWTGSAWVRDRGLPEQIATLTITGGTPNAIVASAQAGVDLSQIVVCLLTPTAANTGAVTLNGKALTDADGAALVAGALVAGKTYLLTDRGSEFRVLLNEFAHIADILGLQGELDALASEVAAINSALADKATSAQGAKADTALQATTGVSRISMASSSLSTAATAAAAVGHTAELTGDAVQTSAVSLPANSKLRGTSPDKAKVKRTAGTSPLISSSAENVTVENFTLDNFASDTPARGGHVVRFTGDFATVRQSVIKDFGSMDGVAGGTGVIIGQLDGGSRPKRPVLENLRFYGNTASQITIGWILDRTDYGDVSNIYAEGIVGSAGIGFAHELKNATNWTNMRGLTAKYAESAMAYGGEVLGLGNGAAYNVLAGLLGDAIDRGIDDAWGRGNTVVGAVINADGRPGAYTESYAVRVQGAIHGHYADINGFGTGGSARAVLLEQDSQYNFVQISARMEGTTLVRISDTARDNVVEVTHTGAATSLLGKISDTSGAPSHGAGANVVYSPGTGEFLGSRSGRFRFYLGDPGASFNTGDRFQMARDANAILAFGTPSTSGMVAGIRHAIPGNGGSWGFLHTLGASAAANTVTMSGWGVGDRFLWEGTSFSPMADNVISLGKSGFRFSVVWAGTGSISTSDEREKTKPLAIDDALLDAWEDVQLVAFKWLQSIAEKGEDAARWHYGVIAQQVRDTLVAHGIISLVDGEYLNVPAFICHDVWEDQFENVYEEREREETVTKTFRVKTERVLDGEAVYEEITAEVIDTIVETVVVGKKLVKEAGDLWGIRADQCHFIEAAYLRRRMARLEESVQLLLSERG